MSDETTVVETGSTSVIEAKVTKYKIFVDATGNEISREVLKAGRRPKNATFDAEGNMVVPPAIKDSVVKEKKFYIVVDENGNEISRTERGKGRPAEGFALAETGPFAGNHIKVQKSVETV